MWLEGSDRMWTELIGLALLDGGGLLDENAVQNVSFSLHIFKKRTTHHTTNLHLPVYPLLSSSPRHAVFAESEIRASVAFQVSRACELLLRAARAAAGVSPWDVVVPGQADGILVRTQLFLR